MTVEEGGVDSELSSESADGEGRCEGLRGKGLLGDKQRSNPLLPSVPYMTRSAKILILI